MTTSPAVSPSAQLAGRVARLRTRVSAGGMDRWLLIAGGVLLPLGVLVIVLGWLGASHTVLLFEQIPYLVSGGFLGLALVFAGGFVYFTYWQTLAVREARSSNRDVVESLHRIEALLRAGSGEAAVDALVVTPSGTMAHKRTCSVVAGRTDLRSVPSGSGYETCRLCGS
jgi:hypothetical protein